MPSTPSNESIAAAAQLNLVQVIDDQRDVSDPFKLSPRLRAQVDADFTLLEERDAVAVGTEEYAFGKIGGGTG